jgi:hypothetical protein
MTNEKARHDNYLQQLEPRRLVFLGRRLASSWICTPKPTRPNAKKWASNYRGRKRNVQGVVLTGREGNSCGTAQFVRY